MKKVSFYKINLISFLIFAFLLISTPLYSQIEGNPSKASMRATEGDTVWVLLNHVKPDKKVQFEEFIEKILTPAVEKLATTDSIQFKINLQTRTLYPVKANEDSSYTYVFLMDPVISKADYSFKRIFSSLYTEKETEKFIKMFQDALLVPQITHSVIQKRSFKTKQNVEQMLTKLSDDWSKVPLTRDTSPLQQIWAADFSYIRSDGSVFNKEEGIAGFNKDTNTYTDVVISNFKVRLYKSDFAVATGDHQETGQDKDGKAFEHNSRFTNVWVKQNGTWQCVAGHASELK